MRVAVRPSARGGLFEFRLRDSALLLRVFCHAYGDRIVLLLHGYDKGVDPSDKRQAREIAEATSTWKSRCTFTRVNIGCPGSVPDPLCGVADRRVVLPGGNGRVVAAAGT